MELSATLVSVEILSGSNLSRMFIAASMHLVKKKFFFKSPKTVGIPKKHTVSFGEREIKLWNSHLESAAGFSTVKLESRSSVFSVAPRRSLKQVG